MRIGIVVNSSWNIYNFRLGLIKSFLRNKHEVYAIAPNDGFTSELEALGCVYIPIEMDNKGSNPFKDFMLIHKLRSIYRTCELDIVLHYTIKPNIYGSLAAKLINLPSINNVTGLGTVFIHNTLTSKIAHLLYKVSFRFPQTVFFQNQDDKELFIEKKLVKESITDILPGSGIDTDHFVIPQMTAKNDVFSFLMVARLLYDKGVLEYMEAIRILRKRGIRARFQILGKVESEKGLGITKAQLQSFIDEGLIEYLGTVSDVRPVITEADCVVLPSYREGTPRTLLEAASLGKPLIATNVPGCKEVVMHEQNGFLCQVKSALDLANQMERMVNLSPEDYAFFSRNSRNMAESKFDQRIVIRKYEEAIGGTVDLDQSLKLPVAGRASKYLP